MLSRFESHREHTGDSPPVLILVSLHEFVTDEPPWRLLVWRLRRVLKEQGAAQGEDIQVRTRPELRLLPGGRSELAEECVRPSPITRGRWN